MTARPPAGAAAPADAAPEATPAAAPDLTADPTADLVAGDPAGPLAGMPGLLGVDHVGVAVPDLEAAVEWHTRVLGLVVVHRETNDEQQVEEAMLAAPGSPPGAAQVQLLAPTDPGSTLARFLTRSGPGLQQLAYRVQDVVAAAAHLRAHGVRVLSEEPRRGTAGSLVVFAHPKDCGGVLVELVQPARAPDGTDVGV
ncbi:methylmalonyl-CoA epimerase [Aquipuribacter hungaricus]|uniref:Methylmalonyl-CoA epimerase n=2 Tax=Aquipuribacter hungaricus TaxID=545624 RepID=A0ABV7WGP3_9MICO